MALATTTLSAAVTVNDNSIVVASATSFLANRLIRIDGEWMQVGQSYVSGTTIPVLRGRDGSVTAAHASGANVNHALASDVAAAPSGVSLDVTTPAQPAFPLFSYSATGALTPVQGIHILNGTSALAMTLVSPDKSQDGQIMFCISNGKANHTVTYTTTGFGNIGGTADVLTFHATMQQATWWIAANGIWCLFGQVAGAASVAGIGLG